MDHRIWDAFTGDGPVVATAIHDGHAVRDELVPLLHTSEADRLREEDPFTAEWTGIAATRVAGLRSRFEVDLNRPRDRAVYRTPEDAWGLQVWHEQPTDAVISRSLAGYDAFYESLDRLLSDAIDKHGRIVVIDLHSYNHRRGGPNARPEDPVANPQVNVGTSNIDLERWGDLTERFMDDLRAVDFPGGALDVRQNIKFQGGHFSRWINARFEGAACAIAVELKKFFMDEWTGEPDRTLVDAVGAALASTIPGMLERLDA